MFVEFSEWRKIHHVQLLRPALVSLDGTAMSIGPGGLAIVSAERIGDDGTRSEVGWVPLVMDLAVDQSGR